MGLEFRKVFDTIPDQFDTYRPRYCAELFADLIEYAGIGPGKPFWNLVREPGRLPAPYSIRDAATTPSSSVSIWPKR